MLTISPIASNSSPPDTSSTTLRCRAAGTKPRFVSKDGEFAIWSAVRDPDELAGAWADEITRLESVGGAQNDIRRARKKVEIREKETVTITGALSRIGGGEMLILRGKWKSHPKYGWSFRVYDYSSALPQDADGVTAWLQNKIKGVGPQFAKAIVAHFGADRVYDILDEDVNRLREVRTEAGRALPQAQVDEAINAWDEAKAVRQIETFLFGHGIPAGKATKLYKRYGDDVIQVLTEDPYRITEIRGFGFLIADKIAQSMGVKVNDPKRIQAGIIYVLEKAEEEGHVFLTLEQLLAAVGLALRIPDIDTTAAPPEIAGQAAYLAKAGRIVVEKDPHVNQRIYLKKWWEIEKRLAMMVRSMRDGEHQLLRKPVRPTAPEDATEAEAEKLKLPTDEQWELVETVSRNRLCLLTGGPGVGKTQSTNMLLQAAVQEKKNVLLCAPTGKAARRMSELTGSQAKTIHRLLEYSPMEDGFTRDEHNPLQGDLLIIDESSMLQMDLFESLLRAVPERMHVLMVGDPDQLPPVGAGKAFDDLIASGAVPRTHLTRIFRQAAKSMIIQNSRRLNQGEMPYLRKQEAEAALKMEMLDDFFWVTRKDSEATFQMTVDMAVNRIPRTFGFDIRNEIMVLAPMRGGKAGLHRLNAEIERIVNGEDGEYREPIVNKQPVKIGDDMVRTAISVGSRIVQTKNMYHPEEEKSVMNGEVGVVKDFSQADREALLSFDDGEREFWLPVSDMDSFQLAWALTIHRSQGSQWPCVIVPVSTAHYQMLSRNLEYVAVTRSEKLCVMVGETKALHMAIGKVELKKRNSTLINRILDPNESGELF